MSAQNRQKITAAPARTVADPSQAEGVGGEPLEGSGFEDETPEPVFEEEQ